MIRGLKTLALRIERQSENAIKIAYSVGIEDVDDLIADFGQALDYTAGSSARTL